MTQLEQIKAKIDDALYLLTFFDAADLDDVNTITTSANGNAHQIHLASGHFDGQNIEGKDTDGNNIHLPVEYIIEIN